MEANTQEIQAVQAIEPQQTVAVIGKIVNTRQIEGADRIHQATAYCGEHGEWCGVVPKTMTVGDNVLVLLQDALLPADSPRWAFMEQRHWRVRMARFKGVPSECVILPIETWESDLQIGFDAGELLKITKYSKPLPAELAGVAKGNFPSFIPKTDEPNFQRVRDLHLLMDCEWYATEKADGTSCTAYKRDGELHVCSRNLELLDGDNLYWRMARKYNLVDALWEGAALQFEIVGPGVQGNPMGLADNEIRVFSLREFPTEFRFGLDGLDGHCSKHQLPMARIVASGRGAMSFDELRKMAEIKYPNGRNGEGIVIRGTESQSPLSVKVINLLYKD